jgi:imidazolonepropionase
MVIRGGILIDGTGAPPMGPVDIAIEGGEIVEVRTVGFPGIPIGNNRPAAGDHEIDAEGMYVLPGFVDAHAHIGFPQQGRQGSVAPADYLYKLWLAHGVTTIREVGSMNGLEWTIEQQRQAATAEIGAPDIEPYALFPLPEYFNLNAKEGRDWANSVAAAGASGIKFLGCNPDTMFAVLEECKKLGLRTCCHHAQMSVARMNVLHTAEWGLTSMEHWYGLPEALFDNKTIQDYPADYNYNNEQDRFGEAGKLWLQAAEPGSPKWREVMDRLLAVDFTIVPTFGIYEATRDEMRARRQEWHDEYTWPSVWKFYQPNRNAHGSFWFYWTTQHEIAWRKNYQRWMLFINEYKNLGGRVCAGSDSGFIYNLYGFGFIRELELLQEAGFHPLEAIRAATLKSAELLGIEDKVGTVERGKRADLIITPENPLLNTKSLYGTGTPRLNDETGQVERAGGIRWTIKGGVVYDAPTLLAEVKEMVAQAD